ncbi:MAG TPA: chorismate mutase [Thermoanaerobaculia bacterium]|jgi:3-deoxy-7-phosphoheptulonate synthase/chorismate mutase
MVRLGEDPLVTQTAVSAEHLAQLRDRIDVLNSRILALLQERAEVVIEIAEVKGALHLGPYDPRREEEMLQRLTAAPSGPIGTADIREIFTAIFRACLVIQELRR